MSNKVHILISLNEFLILKDLTLLRNFSCKILLITKLPNFFEIKKQTVHVVMSVRNMTINPFFKPNKLPAIIA